MLPEAGPGNADGAGLTPDSTVPLARRDAPAPAATGEGRADADAAGEALATGEVDAPGEVEAPGDPTHRAMAMPPAPCSTSPIGSVLISM